MNGSPAAAYSTSRDSHPLSSILTLLNLAEFKNGCLGWAFAGGRPASRFDIFGSRPGFNVRGDTPSKTDSWTDSWHRTHGSCLREAAQIERNGPATSARIGFAHVDDPACLDPRRGRFDPVRARLLTGGRSAGRKCWYRPPLVPRRQAMQFVTMCATDGTAHSSLTFCPSAGLMAMVRFSRGRRGHKRRGILYA
jgi:hypothetical protein